MGHRIQETHSPGQVGRAAVTASVEETTDPGDGVAEGQGRGQGVGQPPPGEGLAATEEKQGDDPAGQAAVEGQAAFPGFENQPGVLPVIPGVLGQVQEHIDQAGPHNGSDEEIERKIDQFFGVLPVPLGLPQQNVVGNRLFLFPRIFIN